MSPTRLIGLLGTVIVIGFLIFGLRQGLRANREARRNQEPPAGPG
jgi:hypothetical protein